LWIAQQDLALAPEHPFYQKLNELLEAERFGEFVESRYAKVYAERKGAVADAIDEKIEAGQVDE
jgi:hypothetical protein